MSNSSTNYSYIEGIVYSKQFRNLQDKTQLFYSAPKRQVRTRLTHTIEVKIIAHDIGQQINKNVGEDFIDLNLVEAIALAHDIGHTPFGHVGERTINDIVSKKDNLGGLISANGNSQIRFKHNVNSMRILEELNIQDWRIIDGALCHTRIFYKNDKISSSRNPYNPFEGSPSKIAKFIYSEHGILFNTPIEGKVYSLTLEGQIVSIADEIAQRIADISDGLESRYFEKIKSILSTEKEIRTRSELEQFIREMLIEDVVDSTIKNIKVQPQNLKSNSGISHAVYYQEVVEFSKDMKAKNDDLEEYIKIIMAQSESVRESDSRSRYIIRQLYKAYLNDITLLPDDFIDDYFGKIINKKIFLNAISTLGSALCKDETNQDSRKTLNVLEEIQKQRWRIDKGDLPQNTVAIKIDLVKSYFEILIKNHRDNKMPCLDDLFDEYILKIGFYIAGLTNTEAFTTYNRIYGH